MYIRISLVNCTQVGVKSPRWHDRSSSRRLVFRSLFTLCSRRNRLWKKDERRVMQREKNRLDKRGFIVPLNLSPRGRKRRARQTHLTRLHVKRPVLRLDGKYHNIYTLLTVMLVSTLQWCWTWGSYRRSIGSRSAKAKRQIKWRWLDFSFFFSPTSVKLKYNCTRSTDFCIAVDAACMK